MRFLVLVVRPPEGDTKLATEGDGLSAPEIVEQGAGCRAALSVGP